MQTFTNNINSKDYVPPHLRHTSIVKDRTPQTVINDFQEALASQPNMEDYLSFFRATTVVEILTNVYFGLSIEKALKLANVPYSIFLQWKQHAMSKDGLLRRFFLTLDIATVEFELTHVKNLSLQATVDAKTSLLLLERTRIDYAPRSYVNVSVLEGGYMDDLRQLVSSGALTVDEIQKEVGALDEQQLTLLYGIERRRLLTLESSNAKATNKYLVQ